MSVPDPASTDWVPLWSVSAQPRQRTAVRVTRSTPQSIPNGAATAISYDSARYDVGGPHWSAANPTRLTCVVPGTYAISGNVTFHNSANGAFRLVFINLNGANRLADTGMSAQASAFSPDVRVSINTLATLNVGDYVELQAYQDCGGALNIWGNNESGATTNWSNNDFSMALIDGPQGPAGTIPRVATLISDWNQATAIGWYMAAGATNAPDTSGNWFLGWTVTHNESPGWCQQEVWRFADLPEYRYRRNRTNGGWGAWYPVGDMGVRVWRTGDLVVGNTTWWTVAPWSAASYDPYSMWDGNSALYAKVTGVYHIQGEWYFYGGGGGGNHRLGRIVLNGNNQIATNRYIAPSWPAGVDSGGQVSAIWKMLAGEYVQLQVFQDSGGNMTCGALNNGPWFSLTKISPGS